MIQWGFWLPRFEKKLKYTYDRRYPNERFDERMDLLAKLLALYPFTDAGKLAREFRLKKSHVIRIVTYYHVKKEASVRSETNKKNGDNPISKRAYFRYKYAIEKNKENKTND